ncbi:MAG: ABC transporter ATP-binding protein [Pseudomonas sp.]|uniref:ABC transporter ATP-binding protein n=1 Tax=Pseudomonas sp. TaxID=306 RepID=UPI0030F0E1F5
MSAISLRGLEKTYANGYQALRGIDLDIQHGEIFALLGPNGAGKSTLIGAICGLVKPTGGSIHIDGLELPRQYREARAKVGLVPQEMVNEGFESVLSSVRFSRGLFGKPPAPELLEQILRDLSLWNKRDDATMTLSGGMRRRVMIAKALAHEPQVLFLDEPTAGVDVELRRDMWAMVRRLRDRGVTVVLTTHYLEEAEEMADRVGVISDGRLLLVENKTDLMARLGRRQLRLQLQKPLEQLPADLAGFPVQLLDEGRELVLDVARDNQGIAEFLRRLTANDIDFKDLHTSESSLEDIFVELLRKPA